MIEEVSIGKSRCEGGASIRMYNYAGNENLTLGQLMNVLCCHTGMALEDLAVSKSNLIVRGTRRLAALAEIIEGLAGTATYDTLLTAQDYAGMSYGDFIKTELNMLLDDVQLPKSIKNENDRLKAYSSIREKINVYTTQNQQDLIDLQMYISRRDVVFSIAKSTVATLGGVLQETAANFS